MGQSLPTGIGALRDHFLERARVDVATLVVLCSDIQQAPRRPDQAGLARMSTLLHRLAGSAGS